MANHVLPIQQHHALQQIPNSRKTAIPLIQTETGLAQMAIVYSPAANQVSINMEITAKQTTIKIAVPMEMPAPTTTPAKGPRAL